MGVARHLHLLAGTDFLQCLPQQGYLVLLAGGVVDQATQRLTDRVIFLGDAIGIELGLRARHIGAFAGFGGNDPGRNAHSCRPFGHGLDDHGIAADLGVVAHLKTAQHLGPGADHHVFAERGVTFGALVERCPAQCYPLVDGAAITNLSRLAHHHAHGMVKEHALADLGAGVNFDAGEPAGDMRNEPAQPFEAVVPAPVRPAVEDERMQTGVAGQHFPAAAGRRVALKDALNVGTKAGKHGWKSTFSPWRSRSWLWPPRAGCGFPPAADLPG